MERGEREKFREIYVERDIRILEMKARQRRAIKYQCTKVQNKND